MTNLPGWIAKNGSAIPAGKIARLLEPLEDLANDWLPVGKRLLELKGDAPVHSPAELIGFIFSNLDDAAVTTALGEIDDGLAAKLAGIKSEFEETQWSKLLQPASNLAESYLPKSGGSREANSGTDQGLIRLELLDQEADGAAGIGDLDLTVGLSAGAGLDIEAGSVWPFESDNVQPGLLRLGLTGKLGAKAGGKLPLAAWLSVGAEAEGLAEGELGYFYRPDSSALFLSSVGPALAGIANPADLDALVKAMTFDELEGLVMLVDGSAKAKAEVSLGKELGLDNIADLELALSGSVTFSRQSNWALSLRRNGANFDVVLSRLKASEDSWAIGAKLSADVSQLAAKANKALDKLTKFTGPKLEEIKPFLSPGTYATEQLGTVLDKAAGALIKDDALKTALRADLGILIGAEPEGGLSIEQALRDRLAAALDAVTGGVTRQVEDFSNDVIENLVASLPDIIADDLSSNVKSEVNALAKKLIGKFKAKGKELTETDASTDELVEELKSIGVKVEATSERADEALEKVRELVAAYENYTEKSRKTLKRLTEEKIGLELAREFEKASSTHYEVLGTITQINPATRDLWRQLAFGRLQAIQNMLADPSLIPAGFDLSEESSLSVTATSKKSLSISISALDEIFEFAVTVEGRAKILFKNGVISVKAQAKVDRLSKLFGATRSATFLSVVELQQIKADKAKRSSAELSLEYLRKDNQLRKKELDAFLSGLIEHKLVSAERGKTAHDMLQKARVKTSGKLKGDVGFKLELTPRQIENLLDLGRAARDETGERALFLLAATVLIETGVYHQKYVAEALHHIAHEAYGISNASREKQLEAFYEKRIWLRRQHHTKVYRPIRSMLPMANGLAAIFRSLADTYDALPDTSFQSGWDEERYRKQQQTLANAAKHWIKTKKTVVKFSGSQTTLHPAMLAFLHILIALGRGDSAATSGGVQAFSDRLATPFEAPVEKRYLSLTMQLGEAKKPTVI